jgi:UPF0042 nucleotide-binding protein
MQFVIITGISGSGKSLALRIFEDLGFFCVDNMPPALIPELACLCKGPNEGAAASSVEPGAGPVASLSAPLSNGARVACVTDVRAGAHLSELEPALEKLADLGVTPQILFLDSSDSVLVNRFKETRRKHPLLVPSGGILGSIAAERELLKELKERADKVIDTSDYNPRALSSMLSELFGTNGSREGLVINVTSFGFKHGLPLDADLVFDVRFLANPHYVRELRWQDGRDEAVRNFVKQDPLTQPFLEKLFDLVDFTLPQYVAEGKAYLTIAIGCTGGRHRSVMVAEELAAFLRGKGYDPLVQHRDAKK